MKKVYSNPELYIHRVEFELTTLNFWASAEDDSLIFDWNNPESLPLTRRN
jgi:hypothetical protein